MPKTKEEWKKKLTSEQYHVLREKGTERAGSGKLLGEKRNGDFTCMGCGQVIFKSNKKFDSGTGWPSFSEAIPRSVSLHNDVSYGMQRTEVTCSKCGGHLGHLFQDQEKNKENPKGMRYCINSCSLDFKGKTKWVMLS